MIYVDSLTGFIKINSKRAPGMYKIKVKGILPDNLRTIE
jgi:hypothetical protein